MSQTITLSKKLIYFSCQTSRKEKISYLNFKQILTLASLFLITASLILSFIYLEGKTVALGYKTKEYQNNLQVLQKQNQALMIELNQIRSLDNLERLAQGLGMEYSGNVIYLKLNEDQIALED